MKRKPAPARRSKEAKALASALYRPRRVRPKRGKGAAYKRARGKFSEPNEWTSAS